MPPKVKKLNIERSKTDRCAVRLGWKKSPEVVGCNIRYGTQKDKLYHNYQTMGADSLTIRSLNSMSKYFFTIDTFNENGINKGSTIFEVE